MDAAAPAGVNPRRPSGMFFMIVLSVAVHAGLIFLLAGVNIKPEPKLLYTAPAISVGLISKPQPPTPPAAPAPRPAPTAPQPAPPKPAPEPKPKPPEPKPAPARRSTLDPRLEDALRNRFTSSPTVAGPRGSRAPSGGAVNTGPSNPYFNLIDARVKENWLIPRGPEYRDLKAAVVSLKIGREGKVIELQIEESSGNNIFDDSARRAVLKSDPLPPPPPTMLAEMEGRGYLELGIIFNPLPR